MSVEQFSPGDQPGFDQRIKLALADQQIRTNFRGAMDYLREKKAAALPDEEQKEFLRRQAERIRQRALSKLPDLLEQLERQCNKNGIRVHWAEDAFEANQIIHKICQRHDARLMVKGKSMASEEIELNQYLGHQGIECLESDMGEYIVQLGREKPSHIIMPAIHKSKEQIARLFADEIPDTEYTEDVDALIGIGRRILREKFEHADIGLSGVNFAIAETGTLCLVENEGNGRMSTTSPPVHVALMGIEKVLEKLEDLPPLMQILPQSATGQQITTYINMISGPRKTDEKDGPKEVHLVLLDNGRSRMYADSQLQQTLRCIRCGACMNHCPVYARLGGHAYGSTYPGPIGQVVTPQLTSLETNGDLVQACSMNGACGEACPVRIPLPDLIRRLRKEGNHDSPAIQAVTGAGTQRKAGEAITWKLWLGIHRAPWLYRLATVMATRLRHLMPGRLGPWTSVRKAPKPGAKTLHELLRDRPES